MNLHIKLDSISDSHDWNTVGHIAKTCLQQKKAQTVIRDGVYTSLDLVQNYKIHVTLNIFIITLVFIF